MRRRCFAESVPPKDPARRGQDSMHESQAAVIGDEGVKGSRDVATGRGVQQESLLRPLRDP